jgi:hypothetical protein
MPGKIVLALEHRSWNTLRLWSDPSNCIESSAKFVTYSKSLAMHEFCLARIRSELAAKRQLRAWFWCGRLDHLRVCLRLVAWGLLARPIKGGGPRVSLTPRWRSVWCLPLVIWLQCRVPEGPADKCNSASLAYSLLDRMVFGRAHPCFSLTV